MCALLKTQLKSTADRDVGRDRRVNLVLGCKLEPGEGFNKTETNEELGKEARRSGGCASGPATACLRRVVTKPPIAALLCVCE